MPKLESLSLPEGRHISKASDYSYRSVLGGGFLWVTAKMPEQRQWGRLWAIRNRMNGADTGGLAQAGGQVSLSFGHCCYTMIPVNDYFDQHPEFFCLCQGERHRAHADAKTLRPTTPFGLQLCLSNRAMAIFKVPHHFRPRSQAAALAVASAMTSCTTLPSATATSPNC